MTNLPVLSIGCGEDLILLDGSNNKMLCGKKQVPYGLVTYCWNCTEKRSVLLTHARSYHREAVKLRSKINKVLKDDVEMDFAIQTIGELFFARDALLKVAGLTPKDLEV